jgi:hypothetical protein
MSKTIELNNQTLELITNGQSCEVCHLVSMERPKNGEVAKCVELTFGLCLSPGYHFKLKKS